MASTQAQLALQMLAQLRVLDPSVSAEIGTPERKIIDTVAQALADAQVDLTQLNSALDVDAKFGANLDRFLALFGFGRQVATSATGFIEFSREGGASTLDIQIPAGTQVAAPILEPSVEFFTPAYETTFAGTLPAGETSLIVPVRALTPGVNSNVGANRVTQIIGSPVFGVHDVNNPAPITGGVDAEDDDQFKVRFKNTVFRNLAGTEDQYLALAAATAFVTKANVVGPISRYREYIQVPRDDDSASYAVGGGGSISGNGASSEWTAALSTIPYSKHIYTNVPNFISNGQTGTQTIFYREDIDWRMNTDPQIKNRGDAYRLFHAVPPEDIDPAGTGATFKPNVAFLQVYEGTDDAVTAIRPRDVVFFEHSYMSAVSRNDYDRNVTNAVDIFIDGSNDTVASTVITSPGVSTATAFVSTPTTNKYYNQNYRRWGEPDLAPTVGNLFVPLFWQPIVGLPSEIIVADAVNSSIFYLGEHYWLVEDITTDGHGSVRARNGIEWVPGLNGALSANDGSPGARTGKKLNEYASGLSIEIDSYLYDRNVIDLQSAVEGSKQVTTDVLVHQGRTRWFKLDITVMYDPGSNTGIVNEQVYLSVQRYFNNRYFGNVVQLSDILQVIHGVGGIDNVRWSSDVPGSTDLARITETNRTGTSRPSSTSVLVPRTFSNDFFVRDDELPSLSEEIDTVGFLTSIPAVASDQSRANAREFAVQPGLIIRSRAQNTWIATEG